MVALPEIARHRTLNRRAGIRRATTRRVDFYRVDGGLPTKKEAVSFAETASHAEIVPACFLTEARSQDGLVRLAHSYSSQTTSTVSPAFA